MLLEHRPSRCRVGDAIPDHREAYLDVLAPVMGQGSRVNVEVTLLDKWLFPSHRPVIRGSEYQHPILSFKLSLIRGERHSAMTGLDQEAEVKALNGNIKVPGQREFPKDDQPKVMSLPTRPMPNGAAVSDDSLAQPGNALTGKQEHCTVTLTLISRQC